MQWLPAGASVTAQLLLFGPPPTRDLRVAVTANRNISRGDVALIDRLAADLCALGPAEVIVGAAHGGDTEVLLAVMRHRRRATRITVAVPCTLADQPLEASAAVVRCLDDGDSDLVELGRTITAADGWEAFKARNRWMVDRGTHCLGLWDGDRRSGTWSCLAYALRVGRPTWIQPIEGGDRR